MDPYGVNTCQEKIRMARELTVMARRLLYDVDERKVTDPENCQNYRRVEDRYADTMIGKATKSLDDAIIMTAVMQGGVGYPGWVEARRTT